MMDINIITRTLLVGGLGVMNYTRTYQDTPRVADIPPFPLSNVSHHAGMYGSNSLHPLTHPYMLEGTYHG